MFQRTLYGLGIYLDHPQGNLYLMLLVSQFLQLLLQVFHILGILRIYQLKLMVHLGNPILNILQRAFRGYLFLLLYLHLLRLGSLLSAFLLGSTTTYIYIVQLGVDLLILDGHFLLGSDGGIAFHPKPFLEVVPPLGNLAENLVNHIKKGIP